MTREGSRSLMADLFRFGLFPIVFYLACFTILTFPLILKFRTHLFGDEWDTAHLLWNMWWVNKAVMELHQPVYFTTYLHYPHGTTLLGHELTLFNGLVGIVLQRFMTLAESCNALLILGFVAGGWVAFLLCWLFSRSYAGSLLGGYLFTFSPFHFAHARGHMQLVAIEWLPVWAAAWYLLLKRPTVPRGLLSACALFFSLLCNYYYALYCVILGAIMVLCRAWALRDPWFLIRRAYRRPIFLFTGLALVTTGVFIGMFLLANHRDPFSAGHDVRTNSLDLLSLFVYGNSWCFGWLTEPIWSRIPPNPTENSLYLGFGVIVIMAVAWARRRKIERPGLGLWFLVFAVFTILAMGPELRVWSTAYPRVALPYRLLTAAVPILGISGCVMRMMVISYLAAGVIAAMAYRMVFGELLRSRLTRVLFAGLLVLEYLPLQLPAMPMRVPAYIGVIRSLPPGGIVDLLNNKWQAHYYQPLYDRPRAVGFLARYPASVEKKYTEFDEVLILDIPRYARKLYDEYKVRYILAPPDFVDRPGKPDRPARFGGWFLRGLQRKREPLRTPHLDLLYADRECKIYALRP
ncbi:MAG: hypothetical protein WCP22_12005 [Chlamydiota bacterium]